MACLTLFVMWFFVALDRGQSQIQSCLATDENSNECSMKIIIKAVERTRTDLTLACVMFRHTFEYCEGHHQHIRNHVKEYDVPRVEWFRNDKPILFNKSRFSLELFGAGLTIPDATRKDTGNYTCLVTRYTPWRDPLKGCPDRDNICNVTINDFTNGCLERIEYDQSDEDDFKSAKGHFDVRVRHMTSTTSASLTTDPSSVTTSSVQTNNSPSKATSPSPAIRWQNAAFLFDEQEDDLESYRQPYGSDPPPDGMRSFQHLGRVYADRDAIENRDAIAQVLFLPEKAALNVSLLLTCPVARAWFNVDVEWSIRCFNEDKGIYQKHCFSYFVNNRDLKKYFQKDQFNLRRQTLTLTNFTGIFGPFTISCHLPVLHSRTEERPCHSSQEDSGGVKTFSWLIEYQRNQTENLQNDIRIENSSESVMILDDMIAPSNVVNTKFCLTLDLSSNQLFEGRIHLSMGIINMTLESIRERIVNDSLMFFDTHCQLLYDWYPDKILRDFVNPERVKLCCKGSQFENHDGGNWLVWRARRLRDINQPPKLALQRLILSDHHFNEAQTIDLQLDPPPNNVTTPMFAMVGTVLVLVLVSAMAVIIRAIKQGRRLVISRIDAAEMVELSADLITSVNPLYNQVANREWEVPRESLLLSDVIGEGEFGIVYKATVRGLPDTAVAVKTLKEGADESARRILQSELEILKKIASHCHANVLRLIGSCVEGSQLFVIIEFAERGSLKSVLDGICRDIGLSILRDIPSYHKLLDLVNFSRGIASGMAFLESKNIVHSDLAARNVLITADGSVKVADFGMTGETSDVEYYHRCTQGLLPVKWMAPESLSNRKFTTKSDRWAFGVLLWEIFSLGASPYPTILFPQMFDIFLLALRQGKRMDKPRNAPEQMYHLMLSCWEFQPSERPPFQTIGTMIDTIADATFTEMNLVCPLAQKLEGRLVSVLRRPLVTTVASQQGNAGTNGGSPEQVNQVQASSNHRIVRSRSLGSMSSSYLISQSSFIASYASHTGLNHVDESTPMLPR